MHRAFALPVYAAVIGALLAIGVATLGRSSGFSHHPSPVAAGGAEPWEGEVDLAEVDRQVAEAIERMGEIRIDNTQVGGLSSSVEIPERRAIVRFVHPSEQMLELQARIAEELEARQARGAGPVREDGSAPDQGPSGP